uniref:U41-Deinotoxin-Dsu1a_1 n=1 Tax=Deinopis subrufa TaxID=1905329 RepID=A0A4Q8KCU9_DEISU
MKACICLFLLISFCCIAKSDDMRSCFNNEDCYEGECCITIEQFNRTKGNFKNQTKLKGK